MKVTPSILSLLLLTMAFGVGAESLSGVESPLPTRPLNLSLRKPSVATSGLTPIEMGQEVQPSRQGQSADSGNAVRHLPYGVGYERRRGAISTSNAENAGNSGDFGNGRGGGRSGGGRGGSGRGR